jgi:regulatory protein
MRDKKALKPLTKTSLENLALFYASRFAVTPAKLNSYLMRKIKERGVDPAATLDVDQLVEKLTELGVVSDQAVANMVMSSHQRKGFGVSRTRQHMRLKQVAADVANRTVEEQVINPEILAIIYARKKRLGVFRFPPSTDPKRQEKDISNMVRAGHRPGTAARIVRASSEAALLELFDLEEGFDVLP